ncbi:MAG: prepilin peptidase [Candidatus Riflebacteria bacterium]|nr:prepilin peptidase [Candidatus Riflebacteria bacterium]
MDIVLVVLVTACGVTDIFFNRIYNQVTYAAIVSAWLVAWLGYGAETLGGLQVDLSTSLLGFLMGFVPFFLVYLIGGIGGGDVKLMGAIGAIKGASFVAYTMLYSLFLGALFGVIVAAWRGQLMPILKRVWYTIVHTLSPGMGPTSYLDPQGPKVNFGLAICFGTLLCLVGQTLKRQLLDF